MPEYGAVKGWNNRIRIGVSSALNESIWKAGRDPLLNSFSVETGVDIEKISVIGSRQPVSIVEGVTEVSGSIERNLYSKNATYNEFIYVNDSTHYDLLIATGLGGTEGLECKILWNPVSDDVDDEYERVITNVKFHNYRIAHAARDIVAESVDYDASRLKIVKGNRQMITILGTNETLSNYQVKIELNPSNFDFSSASIDGSDVYFVDSNENYIPYWIESWGDDHAVIWCKVPTIPANSSTFIWMIYGNTGYHPKSDGFTTFEFFDDFKPSNNYVAFGVFNDVHACDQCDNSESDRYCSEWNSKMNLVISKFNEIICKGFKFAVSNGDFNDEDGCSNACAQTKDQVIATLQAQVQQLNDLRSNLYYCLGNHELFMLTKEEFMGYIGMNNKYYYVDIGNSFRIVILDAQYDPSTNEDRGVEDYSPGHIPPQELTWLENDALDTSRKCIVFCHQLLCAGGEFYSGYYVDNAAEVRSILENAGNVIAVINSHLHQNYYEVTNGIPYFVTEAHVDGSGLGKAAYATFWAFDNGAVGMLGDRGTHSRVSSSSLPDSDRWIIDSGSWRTAGILQGQVTVSQGYAWIHSSSLFSNVALRFKQQVSSSYTTVMWRFQDTNNYYYYHPSSSRIKKKVDGSVSTIASLSPIDESLLHTFEVRLLGTTMEVICDGVSLGSADDAELSTSGSIGFLTYRADSFGYNGFGAQAEVCVRKLNSPEPLVLI